MRLLFDMDRRDYDPNGSVYRRDSARAVLFCDGRLAVVRADAGYCKFPGGGIEEGEDPVDAMIRETREEAGLIVRRESVLPYGYVHRVCRGEQAGIFYQENYYYFCEAEEGSLPPTLTDSEREDGFVPAFLALEEAIAANEAYCAANPADQMIERELRVMKGLLRRQLPLRLVRLTPAYRPQLEDMMGEWLAQEQHFSPYAIRKNDYRDFDYYLEHLELREPREGRVPDSVFFCLDTERDIFVGAVNIRHTLNESLLFTGGHIGDGIRPSERRKGYASAMIGLALEECRKLGISRVLMTCDSDNIGSAKSIRNNGGVLENEVINEDGVLEQRYWIDLGE